MLSKMYANNLNLMLKMNLLNDILLYWNNCIRLTGQLGKYSCTMYENKAKRLQECAYKLRD